MYIILSTLWLDIQGYVRAHKHTQTHSLAQNKWVTVSIQRDVNLLC